MVYTDTMTQDCGPMQPVLTTEQSLRAAAERGGEYGVGARLALADYLEDNGRTDSATAQRIVAANGCAYVDLARHYRGYADVSSWVRAIERVLNLAPGTLALARYGEHGQTCAGLPERERGNVWSNPEVAPEPLDTYAERLLAWLREPIRWGAILVADTQRREVIEKEQRQRAYMLAVQASEAKWRKAVSRKVRAACNRSRSPFPIVPVDGGSAPRVVGTSPHYRNASGDIIRHPSAYRKAWGKPIYHASTKRIEVGRDWLAAQGLPTAPDAVPEGVSL